MGMKTWLAAASLGLLTLPGGCDGSPADTVGVSDTASRSAVYGLGGWGCKGCDFRNSPWLGAFGIERLAYGGYDDVDLPYLESIADPSGNAWPVEVDGDGLAASVNGSTLRGSALVGWRLVVKPPAGNAVELDIYAYQDVPDWTDSADPIPTYGLSYYDPVGDVHLNVCPGQDMDQTSVVFLNGEVYDLAQPGPAAASVVQDAATLGCRGHALAKMKLLGYDPDSPARATTAEERVATLRMVTADYCGDGSSHTQFGTKIDWSDALGHVAFDPATMSSVVEAEWTEWGADCFNEPRIPGTTFACAAQLPACDPIFSGQSNTAWTSMVN